MNTDTSSDGRTYVDWTVFLVALMLGMASMRILIDEPVLMEPYWK